MLVDAVAVFEPMLMLVPEPPAPLVPILIVFCPVTAPVAKLKVDVAVVVPIDSVVVAPAKFMVVAAVFSKSKDGDEVVRLVSMIGLVKVFDQIGVFPAP
jgi:hypothetical protein